MKKYLIVMLFILIVGITKGQMNPPYYIINTAAVKTENEAKIKVQELLKKGYTAGYLWIPDYASLSGAKFFSVYVGPYSTQNECEKATESFRKKYPDAYGLLVSQENKRVQINGIGKVTITEKTNIDLKKKYKYIKGKFIDYLIGDVEHWIFIAEDGKEYNFMDNRDQSYTLVSEDAINPKFKNKLFEVYYKTEVIDFGEPGPGKQKVEVIHKLILIK